MKRCSKKQVFWKGSFLALGPWGLGSCRTKVAIKIGTNDWSPGGGWKAENFEPLRREIVEWQIWCLCNRCACLNKEHQGTKKNNKKTWPYYQLPHETKSQDIKAEYPTHFPSSHQPSFESTVVIHSIPQHAVSPDSLFPIIPIPMLHFTFVSFLLPLQKSWTLLFCSCIGLFNLARQAALEQNSAFGVDPDFRPLVMGQWDMK